MSESSLDPTIEYTCNFGEAVERTCRCGVEK